MHLELFWHGLGEPKLAVSLGDSDSTSLMSAPTFYVFNSRRLESSPSSDMAVDCTLF